MLGNTFKPPTDNLWKFGALAGVAVAALLIGLMFHQQFRLRQAEIEVMVRLAELNVPPDTPWDEAPSDETRGLLVRRQLLHQEAQGILDLTVNPVVKSIIAGSVVASFYCFIFWWWKVQRHQDALLRHQVAEIAPEESKPRAGLLRLLYRHWRRKRRK
jgi:hypothetical protein